MAVAQTLHSSWWPNNPSVIKSHVQKTKRNPHRVVSRSKAIRKPDRRPNTKDIWAKNYLGRKGTWLKMEALKREARNSPAPEAMAAQSWLATWSWQERKIRKIPALDLKQEKCPKLISIREPKALFPHKISWENYRIMTVFGKQS